MGSISLYKLLNCIELFYLKRGTIGKTRYPEICRNINEKEIGLSFLLLYVQKGVQLVTKVCYYLEFTYIYKQLIINKKALYLIAEGCTPVYI